MVQYKNKQELIEAINKVYEKFVVEFSDVDEKTLFELNQRKWAYIKAGWPVWKWLQINSVAPFTNFRPQIRKWKKEMS